MSATVTAPLADELAAYLEEHGPQSGDAIAAGVRRLRMSVVRALRDDERFVRTGRGRTTRWQLRQEPNGNGNETGSLGNDGIGATNGSASTSEAGEALSGSKCTDPVLHRGFNAHYLVGDLRRCIRCDGPRVVPPLTLEEWFRGEGGEDRRQAFENDWDAVLNKKATREQLERFRWAIGATNEAVNAVAGVV